MNLRRTLAISRRIADLFRRDHRTLALMFVAPIVIMAMLGWVIRDQAPTNTRVAIVNTAGVPGELVRGHVAELLSAEGLTYSAAITTEDAARQALIDNQLDVALVLSLNG